MSTHGGNGLINAVDSHWQKYRQRLKDCRHEADEEAVHKLRTSTRRLLALIELLSIVSPRPALGKLRKKLKEQLDGFDALRDTQVMRLEITDTINALPDLIPFLHHLHITEQRLLRQTPAFIKSFPRKKLHLTLEKVRRRLKKQFAKTDPTLDVLSAIDTVYQTILERYQTLDPTNPSSIHRLRIAVKKLRYMLEAAETIIPSLPTAHTQGLQSYLTCMGEIQDSVVLRDNLDSYFSGNIPDSIRQHYRQRHEAILNAYLWRRTELLRFWRADATHPFPW